ncbi:MAG: class I SAM-dependent methyltransferase, partial [Pseudomonadota bacterium]
CGAGPSTAPLADAVTPRGRVLAIDVSPDLVAQARERFGRLAHVELREADAQTHDFPAESYDALYSRFGAMFFETPETAFKNIRSGLKSGGRAVFVAWREAARNQWASVPMTFATDGAAPQGPQSGPGPFAWADPEVFTTQLQAGGFEDVQSRAFEFMAEISEGEDPDPVARASDFMMRIGPLAAKLRGASPEAKAEARTFLNQRLSRHVKDGAVRLLSSAWIITARA